MENNIKEELFKSIYDVLSYFSSLYLNAEQSDYIINLKTDWDKASELLINDIALTSDFYQNINSFNQTSDINLNDIYLKINTLLKRVSTLEKLLNIWVMDYKWISTILKCEKAWVRFLKNGARHFIIKSDLDKLLLNSTERITILEKMLLKINQKKAELETHNNG